MNDQHGEDCYLEPTHHACAVARAARAEGALGEARILAADALARVRDASTAETTVARIRALSAEFEHDLELKGDDWHPRAKSIATQVVTQLRAALDGGGG